MKEKEIVLRSLAVKRSVFLITAVFLITILSVGIISISFLSSLNSYVANNEKNNITLRTLTVSRAYGDNDGSYSLSEDDYELFRSMDHVISAYSYEYQMFFSTAKVDMNGEEKPFGANFLGVNEKSVPYGIADEKAVPEVLSGNGVLIPDILYDKNGKEIKTKRLKGNSIVAQIVQYDYSGTDHSSGLPSVVGTEQMEFIVAGIYKTEEFPGLENQIYISTDNIGAMNELCWQGYNDDSFDSTATIIIDSFENVGETIDKLVSKGYIANTVTTIEKGVVSVFKMISVVIILLLSLFLGIGISFLHRNNFEKSSDQFSLLMASGFTTEQVRQYYDYIVVIVILICFIASVALSLIVRRPISVFLFNDPYGLRIKAMTCMAVLLCAEIVAVLSVSMNYSRLFSELQIIKDE